MAGDPWGTISHAWCGADWMRAAMAYDAPPPWRRLSAPEHTVLIALASYVRDDPTVWPSLATVGAMYSLSVATVRRATQYLEQLGVIVGTRSKGGRRSSTTRWRLTLTPISLQGVPVAERQGTPLRESRKGSRADTRTSSENEVKDDARASTRAAGRDAARVNDGRDHDLAKHCEAAGHHDFRNGHRCGHCGALDVEGLSDCDVVGHDWRDDGRCRRCPTTRGLEQWAFKQTAARLAGGVMAERDDERALSPIARRAE